MWPVTSHGNMAVVVMAGRSMDESQLVWRLLFFLLRILVMPAVTSGKILYVCFINVSFHRTDNLSSNWECKSYLVEKISEKSHHARLVVLVQWMCSHLHFFVVSFFNFEAVLHLSNHSRCIFSPYLSFT